MNTFEKNIINIYAERGEAWLTELPKKVKQFEALWQLSGLKPCDNLSHNYVLAGFQNEKPIILKISPDPLSLNREVMALRAFAGYGAVAVLGQEEDALLLQRVLPGNLLKDSFPTGRREVIKVSCIVMKKLHGAPQPKEGCFPHIEDWLAALDKEWHIPHVHLHTARMLKNDLLKNLRGVVRPVLLHGDLHQENILASGTEWLVIDPKGVVGYPINEMWAMVEDPHHDLKYISNYFDFNFADVTKWYYVHLILAACWRVEDNLDPTSFLEFAHAAQSLLKL